MPLFVVFVALTFLGVFGNTSGSTFPSRALGFYWSMSEPIRQAVITFRHVTNTEACDWLVNAALFLVVWHDVRYDDGTGDALKLKVTYF